MKRDGPLRRTRRRPEQVKAALARPEVACVLVPAERRELLDLDLTAPHLWMRHAAIATYSIVACDLAAGQWGVGVAVEVPRGRLGRARRRSPHVGAIATQSYANPRYGPDGLALLRDGLSAEEVVARLTEADDGRDASPGSASSTARVARRPSPGAECLDWAGGRTGPGYAAQGNILVSAATVDALAETLRGRRRARRSPSGCSTASTRRKPPVATGAASSRPRSSSSSGTAATRVSPTLLVDLRVDDHPRPLEELRRLYEIHRKLFGRTPRESWLPVDDALAAELRQRLATLGYEGELDEALRRWSGSANLEERVEGVERIDPVVLEELKEATG